jgi:hypothetical protein
VILVLQDKVHSFEENIPGFLLMRSKESSPPLSCEPSGKVGFDGDSDVSAPAGVDNSILG